jgi:hypothetical protein
VLASLAALAALVPAAQGLQRTKAQRIPIERVRAETVETSSRIQVHPGLSWPARVELIPDAVLSRDGRESVEYHAEVSVVRGRRVGVAWEFEVVNDIGTVLHTGITNGRSRVAAGSLVFTEPVNVELADGFYALRAHVAVAVDDEPTITLESSQHVEVAQGKWVELTPSEWYDRSRAGIAFTDEELAAAHAQEVKP